MLHEALKSLHPRALLWRSPGQSSLLHLQDAEGVSVGLVQGAAHAGGQAMSLHQPAT